MRLTLNKWVISVHMYVCKLDEKLLMNCIFPRRFRQCCRRVVPISLFSPKFNNLVARGYAMYTYMGKCTCVCVYMNVFVYLQVCLINYEG